MLAPLSNIRPDERRFALAAFSALMGIMATHMLLETTRDALFLASIPASRLPIVYIAIAISALLITQAQKRGKAKQGECSILGAWLMLSAIITLVFWFVLPLVGPMGLYALYTWSGIFATLVVIHFWTLVSDHYSISQARRLYPFIGAGSVLGAIVGTAGARILVEVVEARHLLLAAAGILMVTAMAAVPSLHSECEASQRPESRGSSSFAKIAREIRNSPYPLRIATLVLVSTIALTFGDYLFKSIVREQVAAEDLAAFFSTIYLALNLVSLFVQVVAASFLLRRFSISVVIAILPILLLGGGALLIAGVAMTGIIAVKGSEGSLRHSLYRTASELLYVPLPERARAQVKALVDVVSQRGGQALASVTILVLVALGAPNTVLAAVFVGLCLVWLGLAIEIKTHYLDNFRKTLSDQQTSWSIDFPELDVASLESTMYALNSSNDAQVLAALDILSEDGNAHLIPALLLYHPSGDVVSRTLEIFSAAHRTDFLSTLDRVMENANPYLRAALIHARTVARPEREYLERHLTDSSELCKAVALIELSAHRWVDTAVAKEAFAATIESADAQSRQLLAKAVGRQVEGWEDTLMMLCDDPDLGVGEAAVAAMAKRGDTIFIDALVQHLNQRALRPALRSALLTFGEDALTRLGACLVAQALDVNLRWQIPKAIEMFGGQRAADMLLQSLPSEPDGVVRYRAVRALERMVEVDPSLTIDSRTADAVLERLISRAYHYISLEHNLAQAESKRRTEVFATIVRLLADKQAHAVESILRIIGLRWSQRDFRPILYGALRGDSKAKASSMELLLEFLPTPLKAPVRALFDDDALPMRLRSAGSFYDHVDLSYENTLRELLASSSSTLVRLSRYHADELGLTGLRAQSRTEELPESVESFHPSMVPSGVSR
tara:strand:+ start:61097 stop:63796 length:2700 start_codon:yes stop_codon:yes gene_type:complete